MNLKALLILLALSLGFGSYLYFGIQKPAEERQAREDEENRIAEGDFTLLESIKLFTKGFMKSPIVLTRDKDRNTWSITSPEKDLAATGKVESLITALEKFKKTKEIMTAEEAKQQNKRSEEAYGLNEPRLKVEFKTSAMASPSTFTLGALNPSSSGTYARLGDDGAIVLATTDLDTYANQKVEDFREMRLTTVPSSDFQEVEIQNGVKKMKFARDAANKWSMVYPAGFPIDQEYTENQLEKVSFLRANKFLAQKPTALSQPEIRVLVGFKENVHDGRTHAGDKRPSGVEISLARTKRAKLAAKKPGEESAAETHNFYAMTDKTQASEISRFHFENFARSPEDFVKKSFDDYETSEIKQVTFLKKGGPKIEILREDEGSNAKFTLKSGDKTKSINLERVEAILRPIRVIHATKFDSVLKALPATKDFQVDYEFVNGKSRTYAFTLGKDASRLAFRNETDWRGSYVLPGNALQLQDFDYAELAKEEGAAPPLPIKADVEKADRKK